MTSKQIGAASSFFRVLGISLTSTAADLERVDDLGIGVLLEYKPVFRRLLEAWQPSQYFHKSGVTIAL